MAIDFSKMKGDHSQGIQRSKLVADDAGEYTGNQTLYMAYPMRELLLSNDDASATLTAVISGADGYSITFKVKAGEVLDERLYPFTQVAVTMTGTWRYIVRSGVIL